MPRRKARRSLSNAQDHRGLLPSHLERIGQVVYIEANACPCCGGAFHRIGEDIEDRVDNHRGDAAYGVY